MSRPEDRHKSRRQYISGAQKRKFSSAKLEKQYEAAKTSRNIGDFWKNSSSVGCMATRPTPNTSTDADDQPKTDTFANAADVTVPGTTTGEAQIDSSGDRGDNVSIDSSNSKLTSLNDGFSNDIGLWPEKSTSAMIDLWSSKDSTELQNIKERDFSKSVRTVAGKRSGKIIKRSCTEQMFQRIHPNGEIVKRTWLCYSPTTGRIYCYACRLLSTVEGQLTGEGLMTGNTQGVR